MCIRDRFYITVGAAASLCCVFNGLTCPGDEFIVFAPYFPEYKVFIEGAGAKMVLIPPEIEHFQIDFDALERSITPQMCIRDRWYTRKTAFSPPPPGRSSI